jgi:uncharacterized membrane protein
MRLRRLGLLVILLLVLAAVLPANMAGAQSKSLYWKRWDVDIEVRTNGDMRVLETHEVAFTSGTFSFGLLTLDMSRLENIFDVQVTVDGQSLEQSMAERGGTYHASVEGDTYEIAYFFPDAPISNVTKLIEIEYTVAGAMRYYADGDQLYWDAVGALGWPIDSITVNVLLPEGAAPREGVDNAVCYGVECGVTVDGRRVTFRHIGRTDGNTPLEIRIQFPSGVLTGSKPEWQDSYDTEREYEENIVPLLNLLFGALGLVLLIGGPLAVYLLWRTRGRDPDIGPVPEYLSEPPSDLPPGVVGTLVDEKADLQDVMSTLIDLARRGYLTMAEERDEGFLGLVSSTSFIFRRTEKPDNDLRSYERLMLSRIFQGGRTERSLDSLKNKFYTTIPRVQDQLYKEVVKEGFFTAEPDDVRAIWSGFGVVLLVLGAIAAFAIPGMFENVPPLVILIPVALAITGGIMALVGNVMPAKTRKGTEQAALWGAFRTYLRNIQKYNSDLEAVADQFDRYLAYATAFGLEKSLLRTFSRQVPNMYVPHWYYPYGWWPRHHHPYHHRGLAGSPGSGGIDLADRLARPGGEGGLQGLSDGLAGGLSKMSDGLTKMLNSASSTFTSRPQSTSTGTSGSWSRGSSGGWSGGGFSGGGSSGGHGGGFG